MSMPSLTAIYTLDLSSLAPSICHASAPAQTRIPRTPSVFRALQSHVFHDRLDLDEIPSRLPSLRCQSARPDLGLYPRIPGDGGVQAGSLGIQDLQTFPR